MLWSLLPTSALLQGGFAPGAEKKDGGNGGGGGGSSLNVPSSSTSKRFPLVRSTSFLIAVLRFSRIGCRARSRCAAASELLSPFLISALPFAETSRPTCAGCIRLSASTRSSSTSLTKPSWSSSTCPARQRTSDPTGIPTVSCLALGLAHCCYLCGHRPPCWKRFRVDSEENIFGTHRTQRLNIIYL